MLKIAVHDDYQNVALTFADWHAVAAQCEVRVFDRNRGSVAEAAKALADFDILCLMRERVGSSATHSPDAQVNGCPCLQPFP
jgi:D-3-phosphoglycerate dehydrogenase